MALHNEFESANRRAGVMRAGTPRAIAAEYDKKSHRVVIHLSSKRPFHIEAVVSFSPKDAQGLERAKPAQLEEIEVSPSGLGIHFPKLDADIYLPSLLEGFLGSEKWMASRLGQIGGRSRSLAKKAASKENGKLGGRPKKVARA